MKAAQAKDVDSYIAEFPQDVQKRLQQIRKTIRKAAPDAVEAIKYGIPTFVWNGTNLVHFGGYKEHIGFYPAPRAIEEFADELAAYAGAKGTVRFPLDQPLPDDLITRIVKFRIAETAEKKRGKKK